MQSKVSEEASAPLLVENYSKKGRGSIKGILYMILAVGFLHLTRLFVKLCYFTSNITEWELIWIRAFIVCVLCAITICIKDKSLFRVPKELRWLLFWRSFVGTISFSLMFIALNYLTYSTSMIMYFLYPLLTPFVAWIMLREKLTIIDFLAILVSFIGVIVFAFPNLISEEDEESSSTQKNTSLGIVLGFLQALFMTLVVVIIRKIGKNLNAFVSPAYFQFFAFLIYSGIIVGIALTKGIQTKYTLELCIYLLCSGFTGYLGLVAMAFALQFEKAARIAGLQYLQVVFGFLFDIFLFKGQIGAPQIIGSILICASSLIVTLLKCKDKIK